MNTTGPRRTNALDRLLDLIIGGMILGGYKLFFSWWLDSLMARREERKLEQDVRDAMPFLFSLRNAARVATNGLPFPPPNGGGYLTLAAEDLLFRFCRGNGELNVSVAPQDRPNDWSELELLLHLVDQDVPRRSFRDLWNVSRLLDPHFDRLKEVVTGKADTDFQRRVEQVRRDDRIAIRQAEWEINKRLRN